MGYAIGGIASATPEATAPLLTFNPSRSNAGASLQSAGPAQPLRQQRQPSKPSESSSSATPDVARPAQAFSEQDQLQHKPQHGKGNPHGAPLLPPAAAAAAQPSCIPPSPVCLQLCESANLSVSAAGEETQTSPTYHQCLAIDSSTEVRICVHCISIGLNSLTVHLHVERNYPGNSPHWKGFVHLGTKE